MKTNLIAAGAFALALAIPLGAYAQQGPPAASHGYGRSTTMPSEAKLQHRWAKRFGSLNLSGDQQQRIQSMIHQYAQSHPEGSPRDREANRALRQQIMGQLNGDQQNQYRQQMRAHRAQMQQRRGMQNGDEQGSPDGGYQQGAGPGQQYQQGPPQGQYPQGPPQGQYPQGPPQGQYPQGPPQGQYPQGPPQGQYPQGPPPDDQGPPPSR